MKEMRLEGIRTREKGNAFLERGFLKDLNERFTVAPRSDVDLHRPVPEGLDLRTVFCFEEDRGIDNDWTVRWHNRIFQIRKENRVLPPARKKVKVQEWLDGSIHIFYKGEEVSYEELAEKPVRAKKQIEATVATRRSCTPAPDHPWRRYPITSMVAASPR
ncbi:MAG: hypothetical protein PHN82_10175 [bacterium]|nr:hypothetical protein [bacterium]